MTWFRKLCRRHRPAPPVTTEEAAAQANRAAAALNEARAREPEVRSVAARLRAQREENHFSELILQALREGR
ncbi:DUF7620 family protein [Nocardiopsis trehalosi]|uniref:DUF7620 family protein n=1 Tax=Nocardiopsis trehalosi TaxID=109329 RepID=UPI00083714A6|nr:hypothetical protein [Nocardiopsis trehalosi]